ncbi:MAG TPA: NAD(P)-dependent oxidoreductase [Hyphomicrobiaceae bacterium]|nr:NAD(P)-dependent oxidoreductase [Hyphomicrobiaceae bacterium]
MTQTIAFIGLGAMGSEMAGTLVKKQMRVVGYDVRREAVQRLEAAGGHGADSPSAAAHGADVLALMVVNADQAENVLFDKGALDALKADATVILMSTCAPGRVETIAKRVEASGRALIDAPVSGGVAGAKAGTLTIMASGKPAVFERVKPVLAAMGSNLFHLGDKPGQGAAMKTVNQLLAGVHIAVAAEGLAFAERAGIDPKLALEILSGSAAQSWMLKARGPRMVAYDDVVTSAVDIFVKDLGIVLDAGRSMRMGLPLAALAHQLFLSASGLGHGSKDDSQVIEAYRALAGRTET